MVMELESTHPVHFDGQGSHNTISPAKVNGFSIPAIKDNSNIMPPVKSSATSAFIKVNNNIKIYSKDGRPLYESSQKNISLVNSDAIVKLSIAKEQIVGSSQNGSNLEILFANNDEPLVINNFFSENGEQIHKLVIEDGEQLYHASYNEPFAGFSFVAINDISQAFTPVESESSSAAWVVPLVGLSLLAGGIAIASSSSSSSDSGTSGPIVNTDQQALDNAVNGLNVTLNDLSLAQAKLQSSVNTLSGKTAGIQARSFVSNSLVENNASALLAKQKLETLLKAYKQSINELEILIAKNLPNVDYTNAKIALNNAIELVEVVELELAQANELITVAQTIIESLGSVDSLLESNPIDSILVTINKINQEPTMQNIVAAKEALDAYKNYLTELQKAGETLLQTSELATLNNFTNVDLFTDIQSMQAYIDGLLANGNHETIVQLEQLIELTALTVETLSSIGTLVDSNDIDAITAIVNEANLHPSDYNIVVAQNALVDLKAYIAELQLAEENLQQVKDQVIQNEQVSANRLSDIEKMQELLDKLITNSNFSLNKLENILEQAQQGAINVEDANKVIKEANKAIVKANSDYAAAKKALQEALNAMEKAVSFNSIAKIDEINAQIDNANHSLTLAEQAIIDAKNLHSNAQNKINWVISNSDIDPNFVDLIKLEDLPFYQPLNEITSHLESSPLGSPYDIVAQLVKDGLIYVKNLFDTWNQTTTLTAIKDSINYILDSIISYVENLFAGVVTNPFNFIIDGIKSLANECMNLGINITKVITDSIGEAIGSVTTAMTDITNSLTGMVQKIVADVIGSGILGIMNPMTWVNALIDNVIPVVNLVITTIASIPVNIINFIMDKISAITGHISDKIFNSLTIIGETISDIFNSFINGVFTNPYNLFIKPIVDTIEGFIRDPLATMSDIIGNILGIFDDTVAILKDILMIPLDVLGAITDAITDILNSIVDGAEVIVVDDLIQAIEDLNGIGELPQEEIITENIIDENTMTQLEEMVSELEQNGAEMLPIDETLISEEALNINLDELLQANNIDMNAQSKLDENNINIESTAEPVLFEEAIMHMMNPQDVLQDDSVMQKVA